MIQFLCPGCGRRMDLEDSRAGQVGRCLQCRCKFRVPRHALSAENDPAREPTPTISRHPALDSMAPAFRSKDRPRRAHDDEEDRSQESRADVRHRDPTPAPAAERDRTEPPESEPLHDGAPEIPRPPSRKRRRRKKKSSTAAQLLVPLAVAAVAWMALVVVAFLFRPALYAVLAVGSIGTLTGRGMFLRIAREEGLGTWLACLVVPFYSTYYFFTRMDETLRPFLIGCGGYLFLASGLVLWYVHAVRSPEAAADLAAGAREHKAAGVVLVIAGKETTLPIDEMNYSHVNHGRDQFPDSFEFNGEGTSIHGTLPLGFTEKWAELVGKPVSILPRSSDPDDGDSQIQLPGRGVLKVTGGSFTIDQVVTPSSDLPLLRGHIQLQIAGPGGTETLNGTFEVRVNGSY